MEQLPASDRLDNLILNLSDQANIFRLGNLEIKWIGLNPGQNLENLGLADLSMAMTGSYLNFLNFYEQGILKKYPMVKINRLSLSKDKMQLDMGFIVLPQISD